ncbi:MAG TPA: trypsin-like peptidase domain-containing protein [Balneolales bacterium]|nr:trypsin-like peptidase domain-containing protein [Balneolales bacterium]
MLSSNSKYVIILLTAISVLAGCRKGTNQAAGSNSNISQKKDTSTVTPIHRESKIASFFQGVDTGKSRKKLDSSDKAVTDSRQNAITRATAEVSPTVVSVSVTEVVKEDQSYSYDPFFGYFINPGRMRQYKSLGSGFIISPDGLVVTNQHVIGKNPNKILVTFSGKSYDAKLLGEDEYADIALLKINSDKKLKYVHFGNSDKELVGEWCIAIGNPFGLFEDGKPTVTVGVISAKNRDFRPNPNEPRAYLNMLQTDAAINRGNSGGPLINSLGQVIGMNTFIYTGGTSNGFVGLGFAIPSNTIVKIVNQLEEHGKVTLGFDPGFQVRPISLQTAYKYDLPLIQGVYVYSVNRDGPAYKAGILPGDILWKVGDERIYSYTHFQALLREYKKGDTVHFVIFRRGKFYEATMTLANKVESGKSQTNSN